MTSDVGICGLEDDLTKIVGIMRQKDCGVVPVADAENRLAGMITDRDICLAVAARDEKISALKAGEIIGGETASCQPYDKIKSVLKKMSEQQLKRLPVVGRNGEIVGILSISDVLRAAKKDKVLKKRVYSTLKSIFEPRPIVLHEIGVQTIAAGDGE